MTLASPGGARPHALDRASRTEVKVQGRRPRTVHQGGEGSYLTPKVLDSGACSNRMDLTGQLSNLSVPLRAGLCGTRTEVRRVVETRQAGRKLRRRSLKCP